MSLSILFVNNDFHNTFQDLHHAILKLNFSTCSIQERSLYENVTNGCLRTLVHFAVSAKTYSAKCHVCLYFVLLLSVPVNKEQPLLVY